jgi:hypothetical protein
VKKKLLNLLFCKNKVTDWMLSRFLKKQVHLFLHKILSLSLFLNRIISITLTDCDISNQKRKRERDTEKYLQMKHKTKEDYLFSCVKKNK